MSLRAVILGIVEGDSEAICLLGTPIISVTKFIGLPASTTYMRFPRNDFDI